MASIECPERALADVVDSYLESARRKEWPVSLLKAVRALRSVSACSHLSDGELGELVAHAAVAKRRDISFDLREG